MDPNSLRYAASLIEQSDALVIAAGAGMGVDSGLPDFRGNTGFWKAYPALQKAGLDFVEVASPVTFDRNHELAWGFYGHRLAVYRQTVPHHGFEMLSRWASRMPLGSFVFTSNVDAQYQRAGFDASRIRECHGALQWLQCVHPCCDDIWSADDLDPVVDMQTCRWLGDLPRCPHCGAMARPNVLMFDDGRWIRRRASLQWQRLEAWLSKVSRPVVIEIGAGTAIASVRHFSHHVVQLYGGRLIRINPRESDVSLPRDVPLAAGAMDGLHAIDAELRW